MNKSGKPDFLCIGASKAATTWLHFCLSQHTQIYIPPVKELGYFNRCQNTTKQFLRSSYRIFVKERIKGTRIKKSFSAREALWNRLPIQSPLYTLFLMMFFPKRVINRRVKDNLRWRAKYFLGRLKMSPEEWYKSLFEPIGQQICGEVTPMYAVLLDNPIEYMMSFNEHMRIIYLIRNPIERMWSSISFHNVIPDDLNAMSVVQRHASSAYHQAQNSYLSNLKRYLKYVAPKNLFLGFYEDILFHQNRFLTTLQTFLEVPEEDISSKPRLRTGYKGMNKEYAVYLAQQNIRNIEEMASIFGGYPQFWLDVASELCQTDTTIPSDETFISTPFATNDLWSSRWECLGAKDFQSGPLSSLPFVNKLMS